MRTNYIVIIMLYLLGVAIYGWFLNKKYVKSSDDFIAAGRNLPRAVLIGTLLATWMGSGVITGSANFIYTYGPIAGIFFLIGEPLSILIISWFLARKIRDKSKYTVPELFEKKFGSLARTLVAICIILAYVGIISYQFQGGAHILNMVTGLNVTAGTLISAAFIIFLATVGGLVTVAYTDAIGTLIIVVSMVIGLPIVLGQAGGFSQVFANLPVEKTTITGGLTVFQLIGFALPILFLTLGDQNLYQRFAAAKDAKEAKKSGFGFLFVDILVLALVTIIVTAGIVLYPNLENADTAFFQVAMGLPSIVGGTILAAAVALIITTADSFLLSAATNVTYDIWVKYFKPDASDKEKLRFTRITIVIIGVLALIIGEFFPTILSLQMHAYTMYGAAITPGLLGALLWKKATKYGGLSSIIIGGGTVIVWDVILNTPKDLNSVLLAAPLSVLALVIVSLLTFQKTS